MAMPGRKFNASGEYRYGFNGKENDKDISEGGQDYGMRIYDARLGRFLSEDPLTSKYPELTPYQFASNTPIRAVDLDGGEAKIVDYYGLPGSSEASSYSLTTIDPNAKNKHGLGDGTLYNITLVLSVPNSEGIQQMRVHHLSIYFAKDVGKKSAIGQWWDNLMGKIPQAIIFGSASSSQNAVGGYFDPNKKTVILDYGAASDAFAAVAKMVDAGKTNSANDPIDASTKAHDSFEKVNGAVEKEHRINPDNNTVTEYLEKAKNVNETKAEPVLKKENTLKDYKKGAKIYFRESRLVLKKISDSTTQCSDGPATDTFPRKKN